MNELQIDIPSDNFQERAYIIKTLIGDFLGVPFMLHSSIENVDYTLQFRNRKIVISDAFFSKYKEPLTYLRYENIPETCNFLRAEQFSEVELAVIYGNDVIKVEDNTIFVGLDIFASSFFMLTRWEETVIEKKDFLGRCTESEMFAVKNDLFGRPIVNEYCSFLKKLLLFLNPDFPFYRMEFSALVTHDIDFLFRYGSLYSLAENLAGDLLYRKSVKTAVRTLGNYNRYRKGEIKDPFDTFDYLMNLSDQYGMKSAFFFKSLIRGEEDCTYSIFDKRVEKIILNINKKGHEVGFHPSRNTFHNWEQFKTEYDRLLSFGVPVYGGRQHFLLYDIADSFRHWEKAGLVYDCGMGFSERAGFRCGVCWPFKVFDLLSRKTLELFQKPMVVMEVALIRWEPSPEILLQKMLSLLEQVRKHSGTFVFLWHNDAFHRPEYENYQEVYRSVIKSIW